MGACQLFWCFRGGGISWEFDILIPAITAGCVVVVTIDVVMMVNERVGFVCGRAEQIRSDV